MSESGFRDELKTAEELVREGLTPIPFRIRFYLDSYRAQLVGKMIAHANRMRIETILSPEMLKLVPIRPALQQEYIEELRQKIDLTDTPSNLAKLTTSVLWEAERQIVQAYERGLAKSGHAVAAQRDLFSAALSLSMGNDFYEKSVASGYNGSFDKGSSFLDVKSDGQIFAPEPLDVSYHVRRLKSLRARKPKETRNWLDQNIASIPDGRLIQRDGREIDFGFSQDFVDNLAQRLGGSSRSGHYNIWWSERLSLKEKGVDADLIMKVMDDLLADEIEVFAFFTNDGDFAPLFERIRKSGKGLVLCGAGPNISKDLRKYLHSERSFFDLTDYIDGIAVTDFLDRKRYPDSRHYEYDLDMLHEIEFAFHHHQAHEEFLAEMEDEEFLAEMEEMYETELQAYSLLDDEFD